MTKFIYWVILFCCVYDMIVVHLDYKMKVPHDDLFYNIPFKSKFISKYIIIWSYICMKD